MPSPQDAGRRTWRRFSLACLALLAAGGGMNSLAQPPGGGSPGMAGPSGMAGAPSAGGTSGAGRAPAQPEARIVHFSAAGPSRWAWITRRGQQTELWTGGAGVDPVLVGSGAGWNLLEHAGESLYLSVSLPGSSEIIRFQTRGGGDAEQVMQRSGRIVDLFSSDGALFWLEETEPGRSSLPYVPTAGPATMLYQLTAAGAPQLRARLPGIAGSPALPSQIAAQADGSLLVALYTAGGTQIYRIGAGAADLRRIAGAPGWSQMAVLSSGIYLAAPSEEAQAESYIRCVQRVQEGRPPETVTDWLPGQGSLVGSKDRLHYVGEQTYLIPTQQAAPPTLLGGETHFRTVTDGENLIVLEGAAPAVYRPGSSP